MTITVAVVGILALLVAVVWALPFFSEAWSVIVVLTRRGESEHARPLRSARPQRLLVLVPAHDEALLIDSCVRSLLQMRSARSESTVVVIADNCGDATATLARAACAQVLERSDDSLRGKPHAIAWALAQMHPATYDAVVIIDADTVVDPGLADALAAVGELKEIAVQGYFGLSNEHESWLSLLAGLLARVRYEGQYALKARSGLNCPLTGNGMCIGTSLLPRAGWAPDALTENWELYARYTALGERILYAPEARLYAQEARTLRQSATQRRRWQTGRLDALRSYWRSLLFSGRCSAHQKLDALSELAAPGPVVHAGIATVVSLALVMLPGSLPHIAAAIFTLSVAPLVIWTIRGWAHSPDRLQLAAAITRIPLYLVWRLGLAVRALVQPEARWRRSPRHASATSEEK